MIYIGNGIYSDSGSDTLAHYGVPGMKWGVRKARPVSMGYRGAPRSRGGKQRMSEAEIKARRRKRIAMGVAGAAAAAAAGYGAYRLIKAHRAKKGLPALEGNRLTNGVKALPGAALRTAPRLYSSVQTANGYRNMYNQARQGGSIQTRGLALPARSSAAGNVPAIYNQPETPALYKGKSKSRKGLIGAAAGLAAAGTAAAGYGIYKSRKNKGKKSKS